MTKSNVSIDSVIEVGRVSGDGWQGKVAASGDSLAELAHDLGIVAVQSLVGTLAIEPWHKGGYRLSGEIELTVVHKCVITLDDFEEPLKIGFERRYLPCGHKLLAPKHGSDVEVEVSLDEPDPPEELKTGEINLFPVIREELALALDPYPKSPDAVFDAEEKGEESAENEPEHPFAGLRAVKGDQDID